MHDLNCSDPDDMNDKELADQARYFKRDKKGQKVMSKIMEEIINEEKLKQQSVCWMMENYLWTR